MDLPERYAARSHSTGDDECRTEGGRGAAICVEAVHSDRYHSFVPHILQTVLQVSVSIGRGLQPVQSDQLLQTCDRQGQAGQKIKRRCFVDEETIAARDSQASVSLTRKTVFYGLVSIITALASLVGTVYVGLFTNMKAFMTVDLYQEMNSMYLVTFLLWSIASVMLLFTGIFAVRSRKDTEAIISIREKARIALFFGIAGIPFMIGGIVLNVETLMSYFQPALFSASFFAAIPLARILSGILRRFARDEQAGETPRAGRKAVTCFRTFAIR